MHEAFKALGDPHRLEIVRLALAEPRHVQALADALGISQPAISRHVAILQRAGLVKVTRVGRCTEVAPPESPSPIARSLLRLIGGQPPADGGTGPAAPRAPRHAVREEIEDYLL